MSALPKCVGHEATSSVRPTTPARYLSRLYLVSRFFLSLPGQREGEG